MHYHASMHRDPNHNPPRPVVGHIFFQTNLFITIRIKTFTITMNNVALIKSTIYFYAKRAITLQSQNLTIILTMISKLQYKFNDSIKIQFEAHILNIVYAQNTLQTTNIFTT